MVKRCKDCGKILVFWDLCYECELVRWNEWADGVMRIAATPGAERRVDYEASRKIWRDDE